MRFSRMMDEGVTPPWNIVPELPAAKGKGKVAGQPSYPRAALLPTCQVAHDRVFLCRKVYDPRGRRMYKNPYWGEGDRAQSDARREDIVIQPFQNLLQQSAC